jgi:hypothetical protein
LRECERYPNRNAMSCEKRNCSWHACKRRVALVDAANEELCLSQWGCIEQTGGRAKPFHKRVDLKLERSIHRLRTTPVQAAPAGTTMVTHYMHPHIGVKQHWATKLTRRGVEELSVLAFRPETATLQK